MMKIFPLRLFGSLLALAFVLSCSSPTVQYLGYRLQPDQTVTDQNLKLVVNGLSAPAVIYFDRYTVPHIQAPDERALSFALGYMHGRDRRFQLETLRLLAAGKMRELIGDKDTSGVMTHLEIFSRMIGLEQDAQLILETAGPEDLALLQSYADGVNLATANEPRPMEFRLLNYSPAPWTPKDSTLITALVSFGLNKNWEHELGRLELIVHHLRTGSSVERALAIWKPRNDLPPHLIGEKPAADPFAGIPLIAPELVQYLKEYVKQYPDPSPAKSAAVSPFRDEFWTAFANGGSHSNNWAMSGKWTGTGKAAFAADPHMPHTMPPLGYLAHIKCKDYEVIGGGFVGLPAITFGTNGHVAWGPTSNWGDVADLYVEKPVSGRPGYYYDRDHQVPFEIRQETFRVRRPDGTYLTEVRNLRISRHGVLLNDFVERLPGNFPLVALQRSHGKGKPITALRNLYRAETVMGARQALREFSAMVGHWSLADAKGNIAYCGPMPLPKRSRHLGTVPSPGWIDNYDWQEFVPIDQLPWIENPPSGFLGTANNQVIQPESQGYPINFEGDVAHRYARIAQVLSAGNNQQALPEQIGALQTDGMDLGFAELRPLYSRALSPLLKASDPLVAQAAAALLAWDGRCTPEATGPVIFQALNAFLVRRTLEDEMSPETMHFVLTYFNAEPLVFGILGDASNPAWDDRRTPETETAETVIADVFKISVAELEKKYGARIGQWKWRTTAPFYLMHPFGTQSALASYLNRGPLPSSGAGNSVNKQQFMRIEMTQFPIKYGPVLRVMIDLADLPGSRMSIPGGQSGRPASPHYDDLLPLYLQGQGVSMEMDFSRIAAQAAGKIELIPSE